MLDVHSLAGPASMRWAEAEAWRDVAVTWSSQQRLVLPPFSATPPDESALPELSPVEHTPETLVSIVIATWNRSELLQRALASVRAQTWSHWEALVVDDGSDDDTREKVAALAAEDPRIRLIARPHEGVCAARNAGIALACGGLVAFLDSDNVWRPRFLETMVGVMSAGGHDAAYGALTAVTKDGVRYRVNQVTPEILRVANHIDLNVLVVRAAILEKVGGFDETLPRTVDYDLVLRIADTTDLVYVPVLGVEYHRDAPDRISARHPWAWYDYVKLRHRVDWDKLQRLDRDPNLLSVVLPCFERPEVLLEQLRQVHRACAGRPWEAVVMDATRGRRAAGLLAAVVASAPVVYRRLPMRASFAFAADEAFAASSGATLLVLGPGTVPQPGALRQLIDYAATRTSPYVVQPVTENQSGVVVTAGAAISADQPLPGGLLAGYRLVDPDPAPLALSVPDGHTFVIRADDFARLRGLDVLLDNQLELADLGLRLRAAAPEATIEVLPAARVLEVAGLDKGNRSAASRRIFTERHGALPPTPAPTWARLGMRVVDWRSSTWPHAVRAVLEPSAEPGR